MGNVVGIILNSLKRGVGEGGKGVFAGYTFVNSNSTEFKHFQKCLFYSALLFPFQSHSFKNQKGK
jgi:hypothetical protein